MFTQPEEDSALSSSVIRAQLDKAAPTGVLQTYAGATAPTGWVLCNGDTIGNASSGADRANSDTEDLFEFLWDNFTNSELVIETSAGSPTTRGVSAAADYAANKRMPTPNRNPEPSALKLIDIQYFTSSGTWNRPNGCTKAIVEVIGGGGGCLNSQQAGSGGGYSFKLVSAPGSTETVTVGTGGTGGTGGSNSSGGASSFGSHCSATGGGKGEASDAGVGGAGSGGDLNLTGETGQPFFASTISANPYKFGARGGSAPRGFGFGGRGHYIGGSAAAAVAGLNYGGGGGSGVSGSGNGTGGLVIVYSYIDSTDNKIIKL